MLRGGQWPPAAPGAGAGSICPGGGALTVGVVLNVNTRKGNVVLGEKYRTLWGENFLMDTLCGLTFKLSVPSFYQVNRDQAEVLYAKALEFAGLTGEETVLDLTAAPVPSPCAWPAGLNG